MAGEFAVAPARADVQKVIFVCVHGRTKQICPQYRASFRAPEGWTEDKIAEAKQGRVIYVPKGKTYENAPAAITVQTTLNKTKTSTETLTQRYQEALRQANKDTIIGPLAPINNENLGGPVRLFKIMSPDTKPRPFMISGRFADKDAEGALFSVELTLSALTERGLAENRAKLDTMIRNY
jgi:hypothetical protein